MFQVGALMKNYIFIIFLFSFQLMASSSSRIDCMQPDRDEQIHAALSEPEILFSVFFDVDYAFDKKELALLAGLQVGESVTAEDLCSAVFYLEQKNRFSTIFLVINRVDGGVEVQLRLKGTMIFSKVRIHGYLTGKYKYKNVYVLNEGDAFDLSKHDHSLENMKKLFRNDGYYHAGVRDYVFYDYEKKTVSVDIYLKRGKLARVQDVVLQLEGQDFDRLELQHIKKKIYQLYCTKLKGKHCSEKIVAKYKTMIERFLYRRGLLHSEIEVAVNFDETVTVTISIELNRKKEFVFFGNHYFTKQDFLENLLLYGKSAWHFPSAIISDELRQMYHSKGFWDVDITTTEEGGKIFCVIEEGRRVRVVGIDYQGVEIFSDEELTDEAFSDVVLNKLFDKKVYDASKKQLIDLYKSQGYWDAVIEKEEFELLKDQRDQCIICLQINEGEQRLLESIMVPGYPEMQTYLQEMYCDGEIVPFDYGLIAEQKSYITSRLHDQGYTHVDVSYTIKKSKEIVQAESLSQEQVGVLYLFWNIQVHSSAMRFGKAVLVGNSLVSYSKLAREFMFEKSDDWDIKKIDETAQRLREIGVFDSVHLYPAQSVDRDGERPVLIKVVDADKYEARLRVGFQQVGKNFFFKRGFTPKVGGSFLVNNPLKVGDRCAFHADFTQYYGEFSAQYLFPWLFRLPVRSELKVYNNYYHQPVYVGSNASLYRATQQGLLFGMTRNFERSSFGMISGMEFMGIKEADIKPLDQVIDYLKDLLNKKQAYLYVEPSVVVHNLDDILNPRSGYRSMLSCKAMFDFNSKTTFLKLVAEQSLYMKIMQRAVIAVRGRIGHLFNQSFDRLIPLERFYLGGVNSIRGYFRDYCPPFGLLPEPIEDSRAGLPKLAENKWKYAPQGGRTMISLNGELRVNLYKEFDLAVFTDVGALFKDSVMASRENLVGGAGFGFRYNTPVGPIRFDIAWKWRVLHEDFEPSYLWYLTLGQAF